MSVFESRSLPTVQRLPTVLTPRGLAFAVLLVAAVAVPSVGSSAFTFPEVSNYAALAPFAALMLVPVVDPRRLWRSTSPEVLALLATMIPLGLERPPRQWPIIVLYPILGYLGWRMVVRAGVGRRDAATAPPAPKLLLPWRWLLIGIAVLSLVHVSWALRSQVASDVAAGSVKGALAIVHRQPVYGHETVAGGLDPHTDTYGPANYEAYVPFAAVLSRRLAGHLATVFFNLLTAALLFALGSRSRDRGAGGLLAFWWLAFPLTLYEDALGFNDSIVAAVVVAVILAARSPGWRGATAALAAATKLSPLALVPVLAGHAPGEAGRSRRLVAFTLAFLVTGCLIFLPAMAHTSLGTFVSRTVGFQSQRSPADSLWSALQIGYGTSAPWLVTAAKVARGLAAALAGAWVLLLIRLPRRMDPGALAATSAATLIAVEICLGYYSYSYVLWFAPLVLIACVVGASAAGAGRDVGARQRPHEVL